VGEFQVTMPGGVWPTDRDIEVASLSDHEVFSSRRLVTDVTVEDKDELKNVALENTRTIDIDEFVPKPEITW
jgi:hypothetical protein